MLEIADQWTSVIANLIAIGTFIASRRAVVRWAISIRRELGALRWSQGEENPVDDVRLTHRHIVLERPVANDQWSVKWTKGDGSDPQSATASITSARLRWHLRHNQVRDLMVVGEVRFLETKAGLKFVEIPTVDHITKGGMPSWLARFLFG